MTELPAGWRASTLGELGRYLNGRGFKKSEWTDHGRPIIRIQNLTGSGSEFNYFAGEPEERYTARSGDLLVSWAATLGAYIWNGPEAVVNQHIFKVESNIDVRFHKYLLDYKLEELMRETHGSGMVHITRSRFDAVPVAVPPIETQRRIVEILEDHLSRLDAAERSLDRAQGRLGRLREQVVWGRLFPSPPLHGSHAADLTPAGVDDGHVPSLPAGWRWTRLGDIADVVGGVTKDANKQSDPTYVEVPYLRVANVQRGRLDLSVITTIRVPPSQAARLELIQGDVLLNEGGDRDKLGRGWVWGGEVDHCIHQNHVFRARIRDGVLRPRLLSWAANSFGGQWCERNGKQSVNLASISVTKIRLMPVPVPPPEQQGTIERLIQTELDNCDRLLTSLASARRRSRALRRSLLAAAFSGGFGDSARAEEPPETQHV